jgi:UDP-glucose 4-epimerase
MTVLVTGGAGYIGAHVARLLKNAGHTVLIVDDLSTGFSGRVEGFSFVDVDLAAQDAQAKLSRAFEEHQVSAVMHFAARKKVGESVEFPEWYFQQNVGGLANLLQAMKNAGIQKLVFSSSAAVYGMPSIGLVDEDFPCAPINPYGETKLVGEWLVANASKAWGLNAVNLRYFNVAGTGWNDLADTQVANLVPIVIQAAKTEIPAKVFGDDYETLDGSCVRDYVHVVDLAEAHIAALTRLNEVNGVSTYNVGTGKGSSVFEVVKALEQASGRAIEVEVADRRAGDPASLTADVSRIERELGWSAKYGLEEIVESAWAAAND